MGSEPSIPARRVRNGFRSWRRASIRVCHQDAGWHLLGVDPGELLAWMAASRVEVAGWKNPRCCASLGSRKRVSCGVRIGYRGGDRFDRREDVSRGSRSPRSGYDRGAAGPGPAGECCTALRDDEEVGTSIDEAPSSSDTLVSRERG